MAEWKYDQLDGEDENGEESESISSVSLYVFYRAAGRLKILVVINLAIKNFNLS